MGAVLRRWAPALTTLALLAGCSTSGGPTSGPSATSAASAASHSPRPPAGHYQKVDDLCAVADFQPVYAVLGRQTTPFHSSTPGSHLTTLQCIVTVGSPSSSDDTAGLEILVTVLDNNAGAQGVYKAQVGQYTRESITPLDGLGQEAVTVIDVGRDQIVYAYDGNAAIQVSLIPTDDKFKMPAHIVDRLVDVARNTWAKLRAA
jgi:hypothetical protein